MQLTRYSDYSLRVLIYLAISPKKLCNITEIASSFNVSRNHMVKVVHHLAKLGYITTIRGRDGGIGLANAAEKISIGEVVRQTETNLDVINCMQPLCPILPSCRLKGVLSEATSAFLDVLDVYTIADLTRQKNKLRKLIA